MRQAGTLARGTSAAVAMGILALVMWTLALVILLQATAGAQDELDCEDVSKAEAQQILDFDPSDPNKFDVDMDGEACDEGAGDSTTTSSDTDAGGSKTTSSDTDAGGAKTTSSGTVVAGAKTTSSDTSGSNGQLARTGFNAWGLVVAGIVGLGSAIAIGRRAQTLS
jgi:hypothetical protein